VKVLIVHTPRLQAVRDLLADVPAKDAPTIYAHDGKDILKLTEEDAEVLELCDLIYVGVRGKTARAWKDRHGFEAVHSIHDIEELAALLNLPIPHQGPLPSEAFASVASATLILAKDALSKADRITIRRYDFAIRAASALAAFAGQREVPEGLSKFFKDRDLDFAVNGPTLATYDVIKNGAVVSKLSTEWHLKEGDMTSQEDAARIYFHSATVDGTWYVFVLWCGPHPTSFRSVCELP
jgi:hypothetical protein